MTEATPPAPVNPRYQQLVDDLWNDAELGPKVRAKAKAKWQDIRIPDEQIEPVLKPLQEQNTALQARLDAMEKEQKDREKAAAEAQGQKDMEARLEAARKKYALTAESFDKMVARMKETQNYTDAEAAAAWVTDHLPPPPPPTGGPSWAVQRLDLFGTQSKDENMKMLHNDPDKWFDKAVQEVLTEGKAAA